MKKILTIIILTLGYVSVSIAQCAIDLGPNQTQYSCNENCYYIEAPSGFNTYEWMDSTQLNEKKYYPFKNNKINFGITEESRKFKFWIKATQGGCIAYDTLDVLIKNAALPILQIDSIVCKGSQVIFDAGPSFYSYVWKFNRSDSVISNEQSIVVKDSGTYFLVVTSRCVTLTYKFILRNNEDCKDTITQHSQDELWLSNQKVMVHPNPGVNLATTISLSTEKETTYKIDLYNSVGTSMEIAQQGTFDKAVQVPIKVKQKGIYMAKIELGNEIFYRKVMVE